MTDLFAAFSNEVFRPIVTLVLPGGVGISSWFIACLQNDRFRALVSANHAEAALVLVMSALFVGLLIEDLGVRLERSVFDRIRDSRWLMNGKLDEEWWAYLRLAFKTEPGGRRHIRTVVMNFKFELGSAIGLVISAYGLTRLQMNHELFKSLIALSLGLALYLGLEAWSTHGVLAKLRHELVNNPLAVKD